MAEIFIGDAPSYEDLPTGFPDGSLAKVTGTAAKGVYVYRTTIDTYTVNMWFPLWLGNRITGYVQDASSNPLRISTGIGSETLSTVTSRGWSPTTTGGGTIIDSGGDIRLDSGTGTSNLATLTFTHTFNAGLHLLVLEADPQIAYYNFSLSFSHYDGTRRLLFSLCTDNSGSDSAHAGATVGQCRFHGGTTGYLAVGGGMFTINAFDRIFVLYQMGGVANSSQLAQAWKAHDGYQPKQSLSDSAAPYDAFLTSSLLPFEVYCDAWDSNQARMVIREVHLFEVS